MKQKRWIALGLLALATTAAFFAHAQTIGGDLALNSKTWTFTGLTDPLPATVLFTPAVDGDFLVTTYVTLDHASTNPCLEPVMSYQDRFGASIATFDSGNGTPFFLGASGGVTHIHVLANTPVSVRADFVGCEGGPVAVTYDLVFSRTKLNP